MICCRKEHNSDLRPSTAYSGEAGLRAYVAFTPIEDVSTIH